MSKPPNPLGKSRPRKDKNYEDGPFRQLYSRYNYNAGVRGIGFSLDIEDFRLFTQSPCNYCNAEPSGCWKGSHGRKYIYNGLDRVDSSRDYTLDNIVPCCKKCNMAKGSTEINEFRDWIERVYKTIHEGL
jgi:hypothetical protein